MGSRRGGEAGRTSISNSQLGLNEAAGLDHDRDVALLSVASCRTGSGCRRPPEKPRAVLTVGLRRLEFVRS